MKKYKNILFDLDGTLIDSKQGIVNSIKYALDFFNINVEDEKKLYKFIGPPLRESFKKYYKFNEEDTELAVEKYREYYKEKGVFQNHLYVGIDNLLKELVNNGKNLIIATSKPEMFAKKIIEDLEINDYFSFICGSTLDSSREKKADVIKHILTTNNLKTEDCVMIGDKSQDVIGAQKTGIDSIGVLYGYGDYDELVNAKATYIVDSVKLLQSKLLKD